MSRKTDLLAEQEQLLRAIRSEREHLQKAANSRSTRRIAVRNSVKRIRTLRVALAEELRIVSRMRGLSDGYGEVESEILKWKRREKELAEQIARTKAERRVAYLLKLAEEINALEEVFGGGVSPVAPEEVHEEDIVS